MLQWLNDNRYFVPVGTDDSVAPYIRPGAFFLALKLRPGKSAGDLQPVVLRYASDVGMIPITLTSTGASENMGVQVWMLGDGRAIPRNYHHTVLNDAVIDWRRLYVAPRGSLSGWVNPVSRSAWYGLRTLTPAAGRSQSTASATPTATVPSTARCDQRTPATNSTAVSAAV